MHQTNKNKNLKKLEKSIDFFINYANNSYLNGFNVFWFFF